MNVDEVKERRMRGGACVLSAAVLLAVSHCAVAQSTASNPYGVAGYISSSNLDNFGFADCIIIEIKA